MALRYLCGCTGILLDTVNFFSIHLAVIDTDGFTISSFFSGYTLTLSQSLLISEAWLM
jgi:hypothetical protein